MSTTDLPSVQKAILDAQPGIRVAVAKANAAMDRFAKATAVVNDQLSEQSRRWEVALAGLEGRWYVRGAMHPDYRDPGPRDRQARHLVRLGMTSCAAQFLNGWATHRPDPLRD